MSEHRAYVDRLKRLVKEKGLSDIITFVGPVPHAEIVDEYRHADAFINLSNTGSLDKAVLEAMACGVPVITSNEAFRDMLKSIDNHLFCERTPQSAARALGHVYLMSQAQRQRLGHALRDIVVREHNLERLVMKILRTIGIGHSEGEARRI